MSPWETWVKKINSLQMWKNKDKPMIVEQRNTKLQKETSQKPELTIGVNSSKLLGDENEDEDED